MIETAARGVRDGNRAYAYEVATLWQHHLLGAPQIPNQRQEGTPGDAGGYDLQIASSAAGVYFIQFKLAEHMVGRRAIEADAHGHNLPDYRFVIYGAARSRQHELLLELEETHDADQVEYVAPRFHSQHDLDAHFAAQAVRHHPMRVRPSEIEALPDDDDHHVVYRPEGSGLTRHSRPIEINRHDPPEITADGFARRAEAEEPGNAPEEDEETLEDRLERIANRLLGTRPPLRLERARGVRLEDLDAYMRARVIARLMGADVLVYAQPERTG